MQEFALTPAVMLATTCFGMAGSIAILTVALVGHRISERANNMFMLLGGIATTLFLAGVSTAFGLI